MANKIKVKVAFSGDTADVQSMMMHPMETGTRKDPGSGEVVPIHHIKQVRVLLNGDEAFLANLSTAVSKNPYFRFKIRGAKAGDSLKISWVDDRGESDELETILK